MRTGAERRSIVTGGPPALYGPIEKSVRLRADARLCRATGPLRQLEIVRRQSKSCFLQYHANFFLGGIERYPGIMQWLR